MIYVSNGFNLYIYIYIYVFVFQNLSMCHTYIFSIGPMPKSIEYQFLGSSEVFGTAKVVFTGHVRLLARTSLGLGFQPIYIRGLSTPSNPNLTKPLSSLSRGGQGSPKAIWGLLHRIPSVSRGFDSPSPQDLQTYWMHSWSPYALTSWSISWMRYGT
jgi:hypothetical protein